MICLLYTSCEDVTVMLPVPPSISISSKAQFSKLRLPVPPSTSHVAKLQSVTYKSPTPVSNSASDAVRELRFTSPTPVSSESLFNAVPSGMVTVISLVVFLL